MYASVMRRPGKEKNGRKEKRRRLCIVFCTDRKAGKAGKSDNAGQYLVLRQDISDIYILPWARKRTSFYLINSDGNMLVEMAGRLQKKYDDYASRIYCISNESLNEQAIDQMNRDQPVKTAKRAQDVKTDIMFNDGRPASGSRELADTIRKTYIEIVSEPTRIVYHMLYNRNDASGNDTFGRPLCLIDRLFLTRVLRIGEKSNELKMINVLILGAGAVGEALARTMLWYCQLPGIGVSVTIADKEEDKVILGRVFRRNAEFPELLKQARYDDRVSLIPKGEVNLLSDDLETMLKTTQTGTGYHFVFIASGDDNQNYQLALRVRRYYLRHPNAWGYPRIHAVVWNQTLNAIVGKSSYIPLRGNLSDEPKNKMYYSLHGDDLYNTRCSVTLIGAMLDTVRTNERLAYDALRYHTFYMRARKLEELCRNEVSIPAECYTGFYQNSQSDERSNFAAALHGILKYRWFTVCESKARDGLPENELQEYRKKLKERLAETEQIRWCIFKLIEGDAPVPEGELDAYMRNTPKGRDTDPIRGYHAALRTWDDLSFRQNKWNKSSAPNKKNNPNQKWKEYVDSTRNTVELSIGIEDAERLKSIGH